MSDTLATWRPSAADPLLILAMDHRESFGRTISELSTTLRPVRAQHLRGLDDEATSRYVRDRYLDFARHYYTASTQPASANR